MSVVIPANVMGVIPAKAGIQVAFDPMAGRTVKLGPGLRRGDNQIRHLRRGDD